LPPGCNLLVMTQIAAFLGISALVIVTPGQDTALTIRNTLLGGRVAGIFTAFGVSAGQAAWTVATGVGVGALLVASEPAFLVLKLAGAGYLGFLGLQALWAVVRSNESRGLVTLAGLPRSLSRWRAFRQGLLSNLGNPKMLVFFTSLLPQFGSSVSGLLLLGFAFCSLTAVWLAVYALVVARAGDLLRRSGVRRAIEAVTGTVLVGLGLRLAAESP
jgi:threonine/homoserine/homoserine lactone efflux protein